MLSCYKNWVGESLCSDGAPAVISMTLNFDHPAARLLKPHEHGGIPVQLKSHPWTTKQIATALAHAPHQSCIPFINFLETEFIDMTEKGQWVVLPHSIAKSLPGICLSPPDVVPQRE